MTAGINVEYAAALAQRIKILMELSGLEIPGFARLTGISQSHLYAILNGNRRISGPVAEKIAQPFEMKSWQLLQLDSPIPPSITGAPTLKQFIARQKAHPEYFTATRDQRKGSHFIRHTLLQTDLFESPKYLWQIREACLGMGKSYSSNELSKYLRHLVRKNLLKYERKPLKRRNGSFGTRMADVFYR